MSLPQAHNSWVRIGDRSIRAHHRTEPPLRRCPVTSVPNQCLHGGRRASDAIHPTPAGCVQHQADATRAPTFHCTLVGRCLPTRCGGTVRRRIHRASTGRPPGAESAGDLSFGASPHALDAGPAMMGTWKELPGRKGTPSSPLLTSSPPTPGSMPPRRRPAPGPKTTRSSSTATSGCPTP